MQEFIEEPTSCHELEVMQQPSSNRCQLSISKLLEPIQNMAKIIVDSFVIKRAPPRERVLQRQTSSHNQYNLMQSLVDCDIEKSASLTPEGPLVSSSQRKHHLPRRRYRRRIRKLQIKVVLPQQRIRQHKPMLKLGVVNRGDFQQRLHMPTRFRATFQRQTPAFEQESDDEEEDIFDRVTPSLGLLRSRLLRESDAPLYHRQESLKRNSIRRRDTAGRQHGDANQNLDRKYSNAQEVLVLHVKRKPVPLKLPEKAPEQPQALNFLNLVPAKPTLNIKQAAQQSVVDTTLHANEEPKKPIEEEFKRPPTPVPLLKPVQDIDPSEVHITSFESPKKDSRFEFSEEESARLAHSSQMVDESEEAPYESGTIGQLDSSTIKPLPATPVAAVSASNNQNKSVPSPTENDFLKPVDKSKLVTLEEIIKSSSAQQPQLSSPFGKGLFNFDPIPVKGPEPQASTQPLFPSFMRLEEPVVGMGSVNQQPGMGGWFNTQPQLPFAENTPFTGFSQLGTGTPSFMALPIDQNPFIQPAVQALTSESLFSDPIPKRQTTRSTHGSKKKNTDRVQ